MKTLLALLLVSVICLSQSTPSPLEEEHGRAVKQNPSGLVLTIATVDGRSTYRMSDVIRFRLSFTSERPRVYTAELAPGGNDASASDDFVVQGPGPVPPIHSLADSFPVGVVCCGTRRRYLRQEPIAATASFSLKWLRRLPDPPPFLLPNWPRPKPGDYAIFVQTRRVRRGWPKTEGAQYFSVSNFVVTSSNILDITILPDASEDAGKKP